jgi:TatD DNase family protein
MKQKSQVKLIDVHAHLNFAAFDEDRDLVIKRTLAEGVWCVNVGTQAATARQAIEIARKYEGMFAAVGWHPIHVGNTVHDAEEGGGAGEFNYDEMRELASDPKVVAIGECGLDYFRIKNNELGVKEKQKEVFKRHIELALELDKPLIIHCREAYDDVYEILNSYFLIHDSKLRGDLHFFAGDWQTAKKFLDLGFYLSFTGVITFARDYDEVAQKMPINRLMVETDAPYVAPAPYRGKRNEPLFVSEVVKKIAELRGLTYDDVATATINNARELFKI